MFARSSAMLIAALTALTGAVQAEEDPVATLRMRQERLEELEFALKEAELLTRLCDLQPRRTECTPRPGGARAGAASDSTAILPAEAFGMPQVVEIYGSNGRLRATVLDARGTRRVVRPGVALDPRTQVIAIGRDSITLRRNGQDSVLLLDR